MRSLILKRNRYFMIGITAGVIASLFVMPFLEDCHSSRDANDWYSQIVNNDYDPVIRLNGKPTTDGHTKQTKRVVRPKFYATELGVKENLLICILLTPSQQSDQLDASDPFQAIAEFRKAINTTQSDYSETVIYLIESTPTLVTKLSMSGDNLVLLPESRQTNETPKIFTILNYLFNANTDYVHNYNFIFMMSDRTYLNVDQLEKLLANVSVSQHIYASSSWSRISDYFDKEFDELDSGVLFSSTLLLKCNLNIECIRKYRNNYFNSYVLKSINEELILNNDLFYNSLTTYPVNNINTRYQLHILWCQCSIRHLNNRLKHIENEIIDINGDVGENWWPIGIEVPNRPRNRFDVIRWSYLNESHSFMPNDFDVIVPLSDIERREIDFVKSECIDWLKKKYSKYDISEQTLKIVNFYKKFDATRGLEYIIDFRLRAFAEVKRLQLIKAVNKIEFIAGVPYVTENVRIVMVLPIRSQEEIESVQTFLSQYENVCLKRANHQTVLVFILISHSNNDEEEYIAIKEQASQLQIKYKNSGAKIAWIPITSAKYNEIPTELAYIDLLSRKLSVSFTDSLVLHCRSNMLLSVDFLNRVRLNTILGYQVFFPIPFVEYRLRSQVKPLKNFDVRKDNGYFDTTNYNHGSFYLSDYLKARTVLQDLIPIVKTEQQLKKSVYYDSDMDLFHLFLIYNQNNKKSNSKSIFVMRAIEPELKLKHESFTYDCYRYESNKFSVENCQKRNLIGLGSKQQLAALIIDDQRKYGQEIDDNDNDFSQ